MTSFKTSALLIAAAFIANGCVSGPIDDKSGETGLIDTDTDADTDDTDDTETDDTEVDACYEDGTAGDPMWDLCEYDDDWRDGVTTDCTNDMVTFVYRTNNWGYAPVLYVTDTRFTQDYDEEHTFDEVDTSTTSDGWSLFQLDLETDVAFAQVADGKSLFNCSEGDIDPASSDFQVTFALAVFEDDETTISDCIVFGEDAAGLIAGTSGTSPKPSWLNATNCSAVATPGN